jgi:hypothetical protein
MSLVKVLFRMFGILLDGAMNLRKLILEDGKYSLCGPFGCDSLKCGWWTLTLWTNTLAPTWGRSDF